MSNLLEKDGFHQISVSSTHGAVCKLGWTLHLKSFWMWSNPLSFWGYHHILIPFWLVIKSQTLTSFGILEGGNFCLWPVGKLGIQPHSFRTPISSNIRSPSSRTFAILIELEFVLKPHPPEQLIQVTRQTGILCDEIRGFIGSLSTSFDNGIHTLKTTHLHPPTMVFQRTKQKTYSKMASNPQDISITFSSHPTPNTTSPTPNMTNDCPPSKKGGWRCVFDHPPFSPGTPSRRWNILHQASAPWIVHTSATKNHRHSPLG